MLKHRTGRLGAIVAAALAVTALTGVAPSTASTETLPGARAAVAIPETTIAAKGPIVRDKFPAGVKLDRHGLPAQGKPVKGKDAKGNTTWTTVDSMGTKVVQTVRALDGDATENYFLCTPYWITQTGGPLVIGFGVGLDKTYYGSTTRYRIKTGYALVGQNRTTADQVSWAQVGLSDDTYYYAYADAYPNGNAHAAMPGGQLNWYVDMYGDLKTGNEYWRMTREYGSRFRQMVSSSNSPDLLWVTRKVVNGLERYPVNCGGRLH